LVSKTADTVVMTEAIDSIRRLKVKYLHWVAHQIDRIFFILAEFESISARAGDGLTWRNRFLRRKSVHGGIGVYIGHGFWLHHGRKFKFGDRCSFGEYTRIMDHGLITIGHDFVAATGLQINSGTHDPVTMEPSESPISIGDRVWCGANVTIVAGAKIGNDVVVGA
jgi:maltose O-acetyltransferase